MKESKSLVPVPVYGVDHVRTTMATIIHPIFDECDEHDEDDNDDVHPRLKRISIGHLVEHSGTAASFERNMLCVEGLPTARPSIDR